MLVPSMSVLQEEVILLTICGIMDKQHRSLINIAAGNYSLIATDVNGCQDTVSTSITQPSPPTIIFSKSNVNTLDLLISVMLLFFGPITFFIFLV